jgi:nitrite reductase (NADH) small subunit
LAKWVRLCGLADAPPPGRVKEVEAEGVEVCLANLDGQLSALDNRCPHRGGPLGQGWIEGEAVVCPWHSWSFNVRTGQAEYPTQERVAVYPLKVADGVVLIDIS